PVELDDMAPIYVTKRAEPSELHENCPLWMNCKSHPRLKQHVWASLRCEPALVVRFMYPTEWVAEPCFVIWGEEHHDGSGPVERVLKHFSDVGCRLPRAG